MTSRGNAKQFERLAMLHRPDCSLLQEGTEPPADPQAGLAGLISDHLVDYAVEVRPIYEALRRVVGQIAGLLILAQLTRRAEVLELPELLACQARCEEAEERLRALTEKRGVPAAHVRALDTCHRLCRAILDFFPQWRRSMDPDGEFALMEERLRAAYQHLSASSWDKGGLAMIDFRNACCSCETQISKN
ncbi:hypothetical protein [Neorhizobium sp. P12A]|uniref:hypothetical protein n=1 Tax=Neorhizobium sp. P12A TaxID=2268027 RepID=UPI0011EF7907|nr:hypothetical protein [Neorhizobium sp. P12A]